MERLQANPRWDKISERCLKTFIMDIAEIQAIEDIKEIRMRLERLEKFLNDKRNVDEGEKSFFCYFKSVNGDESCKVKCGMCQEMTGEK